MCISHLSCKKSKQERWLKTQFTLEDILWASLLGHLLCSSLLPKYSFPLRHYFQINFYAGDIHGQAHITVVINSRQHSTAQSTSCTEGYDLDMVLNPVMNTLNSTHSYCRVLNPTFNIFPSLWLKHQRQFWDFACVINLNFAWLLYYYSNSCTFQNLHYQGTMPFVKPNSIITFLH